MIGIQYRSGNRARSAASVSSGVRVRTTPSRFAIRCTWVSTGIPGNPKPKTSTQLAVFGPTPGSVVRASSVRGTSPPYRSRSSRAAARIVRAFVR